MSILSLRCAVTGLGAERDDARVYPVIVTYSGVFRDAANPPVRKRCRIGSTVP